MITVAYAGQHRMLTAALVGVEFIAEVLRRTGGVCETTLRLSARMRADLRDVGELTSGLAAG